MFWRVAISLVGAALILWALSDAALRLFGAQAPAVVHVRRVGGADVSRPPDAQYQWSVDYTFYVNGRLYQGHEAARGSAVAVGHSDTVRYFPFFPQIHSLSSDEPAVLGFFVSAGLGVLLVAAMNPGRKKTRAAAKAGRSAISPGLRASGGKPATMAYIMTHAEDYDDSLEEYYQNGWNVDDPSWQCRCGMWNEGRYCAACGLPAGASKEESEHGKDH